jgi:hypothetical protein
MNTLSKWMTALAYASGDVTKPNEHAIKVDGGAGVGVRASPVDGITDPHFAHIITSASRIPVSPKKSAQDVR